MKESGHPAAKAKTEAPKLESRSLAKGLDLLETLASAGRAMGLGELSAAVGLGKASTLRLLQTLYSTGFISRTSAGEYVLKRSWLQSSAQEWLQQLIAAASSEMARLNVDLGETVSLAVLLDDSIRLVHLLDCQRYIKLSNYKGRILPPYSSALGKAIAADQASQRAQHLLHVYGIYSFTDKTMTEWPVIQGAFEQVRRQGYATDMEETIRGGCCCGVPIRTGTDPAKASLSVSVPTPRMTDKLQEILPGLLFAAVQRIEKQMSASSLRHSSQASA